MGTEKLLRYSMQLAMLRQLLIAKKITEKEHQKIEYRFIVHYKGNTLKTEVVQWK